MNAKDILGKYKGRRVAYAVDYTFGGKICIVFGRLYKNRSYYITEDLSVEEFKLWCKKYKAKRIEIYE